MPLVTFSFQARQQGNLAAKFEALVARQLAKAVFSKHGEVLSRYPGSKLNELRSALAQQDKKIIQLARQQLRWKVHACAKPPYGNGEGKKSTWTQSALIENEISKQQRYISVRDLILAEESGNVGAYMLKRWLEYSASGILEGGTATQREADSDFEVFVMDQIRAMGFEPVPQVGVAGYFIDIGVRHPDWAHGFVLGVECDGAAYHSSKSARDRDRLRQEVLEGLGWRFHRIWSTDWFNNPLREAERIRSVLKARMEELKAREAEFTPRPIVTVLTPVANAAPGQLPPLKPMPAPTSFGVAKPTAPPRPKPVRETGVGIGDVVRVRYLTGDCKVLQLTISKTRNDISSGIVHFEAPIAKALLGAEEGDEIEVLTGPYVRPAVVESVTKSESYSAVSESS